MGRFSIPGFAGDQTAVGDTPAAIGGVLQGDVTLGALNQGDSDCFVWAVMDGSTPSASDVTTKGEKCASGGTFAAQGAVGGSGTGYVKPQYWACCASGQSTTIAWQERT